MAQWCAKIAGAPDVLPADKYWLRLGRRQATEYGGDRARSGQRRQSQTGNALSRNPDADQFPEILPNNDHSTQVFVGENLCAAMNFIYHGQRETGLEIARRIYEAVALTSRTPWKQHCLIDADTGLARLGRGLLFEHGHLGLADGLRQSKHR